ncbi:hypothetical protein Ciccas_000512 [Cichlidogyrus casuarinus]|uniref:Uncharacterized protein n=1 Tax=Cichlidogyrus casuarinus TaxID=1844966 RepID=A0ABD2QQM8_9PLAT
MFLPVHSKETPDFKPRGCGKTYSKVTLKDVDGQIKVTEMVSRFCASSGAEANEVGCQNTAGIGGETINCICGEHHCNFASKTALSTSSVLIVSLVAFMGRLFC